MSLNLKPCTQLASWFYIQKPNPAAKMRLFCFPYAGGGASVFKDWHQSLNTEFEIIAIRLPGRESRFNEEPINSLSLLVDFLYHNILSLMDKPFIFFGHSNGALVCFELSRLLQRKKKPMPDRIILSAKCPPHISRDVKNISQLPDAEFLTELHNMSGTPIEILQNHELMELLIPMLRADFSLSENFHYENDITLKCSATLFYGQQDKITIEQIMAWQDLFLKPVQVIAFSGGHFFIDEQRPQVLNKINQVLNEHIKTENFTSEFFDE